VLATKWHSRLIIAKIIFEGDKMNRRDFLKVSSLSSAAIFVQIGPLISEATNLKSDWLKADDILFRGTYNGEIHTSKDAGQTWQLHTRLGTEYAVTDFFLDWSQRVHAQVVFAGRNFDLVLTKDKKLWRAV
jgi:hypothetical protein